jgi:hypothetical protein
MVLGIPGISAGSGPRVEWTKGSHPLKFIKLVPGSIFPSSLSQGVDRWPLIPVGCRGPFRYSVGLSLQFFFFFKCCHVHGAYSFVVESWCGYRLFPRSKAFEALFKKNLRGCYRRLSLLLRNVILHLHWGVGSSLYNTGSSISRGVFLFSTLLPTSCKPFFSSPRIKQKTNLVYMESRKTNYFPFHLSILPFVIFFLHIFERETRNPRNKESI